MSNGELIHMVPLFLIIIQKWVHAYIHHQVKREDSYKSSQTVMLQCINVCNRNDKDMEAIHFNLNIMIHSLYM